MNDISFWGLIQSNLCHQRDVSHAQSAQNNTISSSFLNILQISQHSSRPCQEPIVNFTFCLWHKKSRIDLLMMPLLPGIVWNQSAQNWRSCAKDRWDINKGRKLWQKSVSGILLIKNIICFFHYWIITQSVSGIVWIKNSIYFWFKTQSLAGILWIAWFQEILFLERRRSLLKFLDLYEAFENISKWWEKLFLIGKLCDSWIP